MNFLFYFWIHLLSKSINEFKVIFILFQLDIYIYIMFLLFQLKAKNERKKEEEKYFTDIIIVSGLLRYIIYYIYMIFLNILFYFYLYIFVFQKIVLLYTCYHILIFIINITDTVVFTYISIPYHQMLIIVTDDDDDDCNSYCYYLFF